MSDHDEYDWRNYDLSDYSDDFVQDFKEILEQARVQRARDPKELEAEANLPARRRLSAIWQQAWGPISERLRNPDAEYASFDELRSAAEALFDADRSASKTLQIAFEQFESVADGDEEKDCQLRYALTSLLTAALSGRVAAAYKQASVEKAAIRGLNAKAEASGALIARAQGIASELWEKDTTRSIRVGDMADHVYARLLDEAQDAAQAPELDRVRKWIKEVAPDYAKRPGRPPRKS
ncbi:hypothetical protein [Pseudomonas sp. JUb52]|uniref:hypothetical protein n=1 Tax=Pseudomonas sp. JUb52 TaxID=2485127 RepID=UPI0010480BA3|nr:hypothetical protein [Pseudomonas sp. JUb52]TCQ87838.1 hypothetical protein EC839_106114 [Pseudomonas sp. JUb52]